jgi:hypothetical protein
VLSEIFGRSSNLQEKFTLEVAANFLHNLLHASAILMRHQARRWDQNAFVKPSLKRIPFSLWSLSRCKSFERFVFLVRRSNSKAEFLISIKWFFREKIRRLLYFNILRSAQESSIELNATMPELFTCPQVVQFVVVFYRRVAVSLTVWNKNGTMFS